MLQVTSSTIRLRSFSSGPSLEDKVFPRRYQEKASLDSCRDRGPTSISESNTTIINKLVEKFAASGVPLHTPWTLYVDKTPTQGSTLADYTQNLRKIYTFSTIEEFWQVFNNIPLPKKLSSMYSFHVMRGNRKPIWEDPQNEHGGYWKLKCNKKFSNKVWKELLLAAIGEQFNNCITIPTDQVVGITVSVRDKDDHFQIWNENYKGAEEAVVVEKVTKELLPKVKFHSIYYKEHKEHDDFNSKSYSTRESSYKKLYGVKNKDVNANLTPRVRGGGFFRTRNKSVDILKN